MMQISADVLVTVVTTCHTFMIDIRNPLDLIFSCNIKFLNSSNNIIVTTVRNVHHCNIALTIYVERLPNKCVGPSHVSWFYDVTGEFFSD